MKFIEDDFLGGARIDPATDGRPDPRPSVRENEAQLGNLSADFDFNQRPLPPLILSPRPLPGRAALLQVAVTRPRTVSLRAARPTVPLRIRCNDGCRVIITAHVLAGGRTVGRAAAPFTRSLPARRTGTLIVRLTRRARALLGRGMHRRLGLTLTFHSRIGPVRVVHRTLSARH